MDSPLQIRIAFLLYRYRFLLVYVVIGFCSILTEILLFKALTTFCPPDVMSKLELPAKISGVAAAWRWPIS